MVHYRIPGIAPKDKVGKILIKSKNQDKRIMEQRALSEKPLRSRRIKREARMHYALHTVLVSKLNNSA